MGVSKNKNPKKPIIGFFPRSLMNLYSLGWRIFGRILPFFAFFFDKI